jgi:hypothetical protein
MRCSHRPTSLTVPRALMIASLLLTALACGASIGGNRAAHAAARATGTTVHYGSGWNIVSVPTGTTITGASGSLLSASPAVDGYLDEASNTAIGGRAYWAFFPTATDIPLGPTAATYTQLHLRADHFALIGNPSTTQTLPINGADAAFTYDPQLGYQQTTQLQPGQGAFVLSHAGGWVSVGTPPSQSVLGPLQSMQDELTNNAADPTTFGMIPALAASLLSNRQYDAVQGSMDDLRAAFADGLAVEKAATQPALTATQFNNLASMRSSLAEAQNDVSAGTPELADAAIQRAQTQAQSTEDEAAKIARTSDAKATSSSALLSRYFDATYTPQSLARYGDLCTATVPALALNLAPTPQFIDLVVATLNNQPPPSS